MQAHTRSAINAILAADSTISQQEIKVLTDALSYPGRAAEIARPMTRKEAAAALGCCLLSITNYANKGYIRRVIPASGNQTGRGVRYCREDVERLARGETPVIEKARCKGKRGAA